MRITYPWSREGEYPQPSRIVSIRGKPFIMSYRPALLAKRGAAGKLGARPQVLFNPQQLEIGRAHV